MKAGIITFHWATNYGAILQCYALQEALRMLGHEVKVIDYKPSRYNDTLWSFIRFRKFTNLRKYLINRRKENRLQNFRASHLLLTERFSHIVDLQKRLENFDVLITGSDQVLNQSFLQHGEPKGSTAYFLDFGSEATRRYAYAASFGVVKYPQDLCDRVNPLLNNFSSVSARENSGRDIFKSMGRNDAIVVPDPTLLHDRTFYDSLLQNSPKTEYIIRSYMLHGAESRISSALRLVEAEAISDQSIIDWINVIRSSRHLITNSFHGTVFCLLYHVPFTVVLHTKDNVGMNDRLYTLLEPLGLTNRIVCETEFNTDSIEFTNTWESIDAKLTDFRATGWNFLKSIK